MTVATQIYASLGTSQLDPCFRITQNVNRSKYALHEILCTVNNVSVKPRIYSVKQIVVLFFKLNSNIL